MKGIISGINTDSHGVTVLFPAGHKFLINQPVEVKAIRKGRSTQANALYWDFLTWCIAPDGGNLHGMGHYSADTLHQNIKAWLKETYPHETKTDFSTSDLNTLEFSDFMEKVNLNLMIEFFGIDTSGFWDDYQIIIDII